jgi:acyl-CoA synthetase (AMP-forming)/AMP-acid ligase II
VIAQKFKAKCNASTFVGFGLTELSPVSHVCRREKLETEGIIGSPLPMTASKIIDVETGKSLGRNINGELCVKGPQVMKGYLNNPEATKAMIDKDGWLHTGDWGYYDDENDFFVVDRIKDIIKVKGFQVSPTELENLLKTHPNIADVAVIGVPDSRAGELPRAYVVPKPGVTVTEQELNDFMKDKVAAFKQLNGGVEILDAIPRNPTGKILRKDLLSSFKEKHL